VFRNGANIKISIAVELRICDDEQLYNINKR